SASAAGARMNWIWRFSLGCMPVQVAWATLVRVHWPSCTSTLARPSSPSSLPVITTSLGPGPPYEAWTSTVTVAAAPPTSMYESPPESTQWVKSAACAAAGKASAPKRTPKAAASVARRARRRPPGLGLDRETLVLVRLGPAATVIYIPSWACRRAQQYGSRAPRRRSQGHRGQAVGGHAPPAAAGRRATMPGLV